MKILHIDSSILGSMSASRELTQSIIAQLKTTHTDAQVNYLDLASDPIDHLSTGEFMAIRGEAPKDAQLQAKVELNTKFVDDFLAADIVVIGAPMYNFTVPSQLKTWLDRICVANKTFRYTESGPEGLTQGKRVIVASTRGGMYSEGSEPRRVA